MGSSKNRDRSISLAVIVLQYPPIGGGYSERITGFVKQWIRRGLCVHVVTAEPHGLGMPLDPESEADVYGTASVTRLPTLQGYWRRTMLGAEGLFSPAWRLLNRLIPVDAHLPWSLIAARAVSRLYRQGKVDIVLTSSTPYSVHLGGLWLRRRYPTLTWIADFRDPWTTNYQQAMARRLPASRLLERRLEQAVYDTADRVVINTQQNLEEVRDCFRLPAAKAYVIQNGYDPDISLRGIPRWPRRDGRFRLGYIGGFRGDWFEGPFLRALAKLKESTPTIYERLDVLLVGSDNAAGTLQESLGVSDRLHCCGFYPRHCLGDWISSMDALLLILPDNGGRPLGWVPQRLYLYLAARLPILSIVPDGEAARYIRESGSGVVLPPTNSDIIVSALREWIENGPPSLDEKIPREVGRFSKAVLAEHFCSLFQEVGRRRKVFSQNHAAKSA